MAVRWLQTEFDSLAFLPRDAMLASAVHAVIVCPSVRLSQAGNVLSKQLDESSWFGTEASFLLPQTVL